MGSRDKLSEAAKSTTDNLGSSVTRTKMLSFMFSLISLLPLGVFSATQCQLSIVRCCDAGNCKLPFRCFEVNGCPGLIWAGKQACSGKNVAAAINAINSRNGSKVPLEASVTGNNTITIDTTDKRKLECTDKRTEKLDLRCGNYIRPIITRHGNLFLKSFNKKPPKKC